MMALLIVGGVIAVILIWAIAIYNQLVSLKNRFKNAFAQIDVQLKRRYDLIPNLVETAKGYLKHERETLEAVIQARNQAHQGLQQAAANPADGQALNQLMQAEAQLGSALSRFNLLVEAYPDLKASQNMAQLTEELTSTENRVAFARQGFNDAVMSYNTYRQQFPNVVIANSFGFADAQLLEFADKQQIEQAPKVSF